MADPLPRPGSILLGNTSQVGINASGYVVLHDPDYLLLETGTTDATLLETGTTDGLLLEPYDCACCPGEDGECGECTDPLPDTVTVDLGATAFLSASSSYYSDCGDPCASLTGEIVLNKASACYFVKYYEPFCARPALLLEDDGPFTEFLDPDYLVDMRVRIYAEIIYSLSSAAFVWRVVVMSSSQVGFSWIIDRYVSYITPTTTACIGKTYSAIPKIVDVYSSPVDTFKGRPFLPCNDTGITQLNYPMSDSWTFPDTIDLIVP